MSQTTRLHRYTYADYVGIELGSSGKHEFFDGEIYAMAGGTEDHSALSVAITSALLRAAAGGECRGRVGAGREPRCRHGGRRRLCRELGRAADLNDRRAGGQRFARMRSPISPMKLRAVYPSRERIT